MFCIAIDSPMEVPTKWPMGTSKWPLLGNPFTLECPLAANPPANYSWRKYASLNRNKEIVLSDQVVFSKNGKVWHISSYSENENGVYECRASNQLGAEVYSDDILFFLQPNRKLGIQTRPNSICYLSGQEVWC